MSRRKFQSTIGRVMLVVAAFAVVFALFRFIGRDPGLVLLLVTPFFMLTFAAFLMFGMFHVTFALVRWWSRANRPGDRRP